MLVHRICRGRDGLLHPTTYFLGQWLRLVVCWISGRFIHHPWSCFSLQARIAISFYPFLHLLTWVFFAGFILVLGYVRWSLLIHTQPTLILLANQTACFKSGGFYCQIPASSSVFPVECWWHPVSSLAYHWHVCVSYVDIPRGCDRSKDCFPPQLVCIRMRNRALCWRCLWHL